MQGSLSGNKGPRYRHSADDSVPYETISVDKLTPIIGAEIDGIDLSKPLSNRQQDELHRALAENLVIFFRDQHITPDQHLAFGRLFGELHVHPAAPHEPGKPELMIIHADKDSPRANGEGWHTDVSCDLEPPMGSILYIKTCPPKGGDTLFASMYAAYESLSDRMKTYLEGMTAIHDGEQVYRGLYKNFGVTDKPQYPRAEHPVIRTHPVTGKKALYVNRGFTRGLVGRAARRGRRHPALSLRAHGEPAVPVPLPLARELHRLLGQPLRPAPRDVGLLAAYAQRKPGYSSGRQTLLTSAPFAGAGHAKKAVLVSDLRLRRRAGRQRAARLRKLFPRAQGAGPRLVGRGDDASPDGPFAQDRRRDLRGRARSQAARRLRRDDAGDHLPERFATRRCNRSPA